MPVKLREGTPAHRIYVTAAWLVVVAAIVYVPLATTIGWTPAGIGTVARINQLNNLMAYAVAILGLNVVIGFSGQLSLGQSAFVGLGAYTTVILVSDHHWSFFSAMAASAGISLVAGLLIGLPATRIKGVVPGDRHARHRLHLPRADPALRVADRRVQRQVAAAHGGEDAQSRRGCRSPTPAGSPDRCGSTASSPSSPAASFLLARNAIKSRVGRALIAMRDNEASAATMGINVALYKATAFAVERTVRRAGGLDVDDEPGVRLDRAVRHAGRRCSSSPDW